MGGAPWGHTHLISCDNSVALPGENQKTFDSKMIVRDIEIFANNFFFVDVSPRDISYMILFES